MPTAKSRARRSPEQLAQQAEALQALLVDQVEELTTSEGWMRFLAAAQSFHAYSLTNVLLILAQRPDATQVAGFRQWQDKGRQVRKGERALKIRGFSKVKRTTEDPATGEEVERTAVRFPILSVFDVSQTDPIEGSDAAPLTLARRLEGDDQIGVFDAMADHMRGQGWQIDREPIAGAVNGWTTVDGTRRIVVDSDLSPAQSAKTMIHEAAHATLHADGEDPARNYVEHRGQFECEAESVAYVLAGLVGLDTAPYSVGYIAQWTAGDVDVVRDSAATVLRGVRTLAAALIDTDSPTP